MKRWVVAALVLVLIGWWMAPPMGRDRAPGVLAPQLPVQEDLHDATAIEHGDFLLTPLARFTIEARVLGREDYRFDAEAALSPMDLALGWGRMSDSAVLDRLDIRQSMRFYSYRWRDQPPVPPREIVASSANMHLVPADGAIARQLKRVRRGDVVRIEGYLIQARRHDGWLWRSSLTRQDSGAGACELVYVTAVSHS
ncbi:hypothetical protein OS187_04490 [Xanthomonadaceae bacterium JHOS43]|nr:hypothetical protein [Xanthomonadaceae bacterium JHOS43]